MRGVAITCATFGVIAAYLFFACAFALFFAIVAPIGWAGAGVCAAIRWVKRRG